MKNVKFLVVGVPYSYDFSFVEHRPESLPFLHYCYVLSFQLVSIMSDEQIDAKVKINELKYQIKDLSLQLVRERVVFALS